MERSDLKVGQTYLYTDGGKTTLSNLWRATVLSIEPGTLGYDANGKHKWQPGTSVTAKGQVHVMLTSWQGSKHGEFNGKLPWMLMSWNGFLEGKADKKKWPGLATARESIKTQGYNWSDLKVKPPMVLKPGKKWEEPDNLGPGDHVNADGSYGTDKGGVAMWYPPPQQYLDDIAAAKKKVTLQFEQGKTHMTQYVEAVGRVLNEHRKETGVQLIENVQVQLYPEPKGYRGRVKAKEGKVSVLITVSTLDALLEIAGVG